MFTVKKKAKTPNIIWDEKNKKPLCKFKDGIFKTNDKLLVEKLKSMGHDVSGEPDAKTLDKMKVEELKAYAAEHNIDLGDATNRTDILKVIKEAEKEQ